MQGYICPMAAKSKSNPNNISVAQNRKARYHYAIEDTIECGMMLVGSEVKAMRAGGVNIAESYANIEDGELWLINAHVPKYEQAKTFQHEERRKRKLLVSKRELANLHKNTGREGMTLVPLKIYFNDKGRAKLLLGIAKGKKLQDKRATEKKRDWQKQQGRLLRERG